MLTDSIRIDHSVRPFRCLFAVADAAEFKEAVRLSSHLWGGRLHPILPLPRSERQEGEFARAIYRLDPDGVYFLGERSSTRAQRALGRQARPVGRVTLDQIQKHIDGSQPFMIRGGNLPHVYQALRGLYPTGLQSSMIRTVSPADDDLTGAVLFGLASSQLKEFLHKSLSAISLRPPEDAASWIRHSLLRHSVLYPVEAASGGCNVSATLISGGAALTVLETPLTLSPHVAFIFAPSDGDIGVNAAFWNVSAYASRATKLVVPLKALRTAIEESLRQMFEAFVPTQIVVVVDLPKHEARGLAEEMAAAISRLEAASQVAVLRIGFAHSCLEASIRSSPKTSVAVARDQLNRFGVALTPPESVAQVDTVFAVDATVTSNYGDKLGLPNDEVLPPLLSNEQIRIENARQNVNGLGRLWLRSDRFVRPSRPGITGVSRPGLEFELFLHPDEYVVSQIVENRGFELNSSSHNRYVKGLIRRMGGLSEVLRLVRRDGLRILDVFVFDDSDQPGLLRNQIVQRLARLGGIKDKDARDQFDALLPLLLKSELLVRGVGLRCPECSLKQWVRIDALSEFVRCNGCYSEFQLMGGGIEFRFVLNELARTLLRTGGAAVLECASTLKAIDGSIAISFGGEVKMPDQSEGEIDLMAVTPTGLLFAECKSYRSPRKKGVDAFVDDVRASVENLFHATRIAGLSECLLCVSCFQQRDAILGLAQNLAEEGRTLGIDLDLILNRQYYLRCKELREPHQLTFRNPPQVRVRKDTIVGKVVSAYSFSGTPSIDTDVIREWDRKSQVAA